LPKIDFFSQPEKVDQANFKTIRTDFKKVAGSGIFYNNRSIVTQNHIEEQAAGQSTDF
jgi:hypothetical protein